MEGKFFHFDSARAKREGGKEGEGSGHVSKRVVQLTITKKRIDIQWSSPAIIWNRLKKRRERKHFNWLW